MVFISSKIEVRKSPIHGMGVFAKENIKSGEIIENCHFTILEKNLTLYILPKMYKEFSTYFLDTFQEKKVEYNQKQKQFLIVNPFIVQKYSQQVNSVFNSKFLLSKKYLFNN
jgi:SET domain-containing protein